MKAKDITVNQFLQSCKNVVDTARTHGWRYGNSTTKPPCSDRIISCDRLIARALWDLGFTDQRRGGETCGSLDGYLSSHGFVRSTRFSDIKKGSIILVKHNGIGYWSHAFVCLSFNPATYVTSRYDTGSNQRIQSVQPLTNLAWGYRRDTVLVYNIPEQPSGPTPHKLIADGQKELRKVLDLGGLPRATGLYTDEWKVLFRKGVQAALNADHNCGLKVDGVFGDNTRLMVSRYACELGERSNLVRMLQIGFCLNNQDPGGIDGIYGDKTLKLVRAARKKAGQSESSVAGIAVFEILAK